MAAVLAHSIYRYTTGGYNAQEGVKQISPPKEGQSVMDKQVGAVLQQEPLLLSQTPFWWANPFQFFSLPVILLCAMIVFVIIRTVWAQRSKAHTLEEAKVQELVEKSKTPGGRRRLSISERTVVRKSFIQKYAQEVVIVQSGYLKKRATTHAFSGYQRRYFELDNRKVLRYWKSIFDKNEGQEPRRTFYFDDPNDSEPPILSPMDMADNVSSSKIKIIFSIDESHAKDLNNGANKEIKEVLELEAPGVHSAKAWREAFKKALNAS
eukprot:g12768.t1